MIKYLKVGFLCWLTIVTAVKSRAQEAMSPASAVASEVTVTGEAPDAASPRQEIPVGPNRQPEWTTEPSFGTSRVYVRPPGQVELVQFWTPELGRNGDVSHALRNEVEIGLPYRFQLDLYENWGRQPGEGFRSTGQSVELRYALAEWGRIRFNPTVYGEWTFNSNAPDVLELKLLLGEVFARRWHAAANITFEQETGGEREKAWQLSSALSYAVVDRVLNVGLEALLDTATVSGARSDPKVQFLAGPSFNIRPTPRTFINLAPLFGMTHDAPHAQIFVSAGIRFGGRAGRDEGAVAAPASMFGR